MADEENPNPKICGECREAPWKYRCPGCPAKTCCLLCVKSHKERTGCTGKRKLTEFVPISEFNDNILISDYNMLEDTKRAVESARRKVKPVNKFRGYVGFRLPAGLQKLRKAADLRKTRLLLLPPGMSMREANKSRFDTSKRRIFWTVEWKFHSTGVVRVDHNIDEHMSLSSAIEKHLTPTPLRNQLSPYRNVPLDELKFFIRKNPKGLKSPFRELDVRAPIRQQLEDVIILEYPVIFVFLPSQVPDFEVEKIAKLSPKKESHPVPLESVPSPKGKLFIEEEIDEDEAETLVTDINDSVPNTILEDSKPVSYQKLRTSPKHTSEAVPSDEAKVGLYDMDNTVIPPEDVTSRFQKELVDAYSELVGEINPDDFLCFDGDCVDVESLQLLWGDDEMEEGEIPGF